MNCFLLSVKVYYFSEIRIIITYMKKLLDSVWLRAVQLKSNTSAKSVIYQCKKRNTSAKSVTPVQKV